MFFKWCDIIGDVVRLPHPAFGVQYISTPENLLELLRFYLVVGWHQECYLQESGACIDCCVASVLSDIDLSKVDRDIEKSLGTINVKKSYDTFTIFWCCSRALANSGLTV